MEEPVEAGSWDPGSVKGGSKLGIVMRLIRIEHTLFSLPFAYAGAILSGYPLSWREALLIFTAVLGLRSSAMAYNNIADLPIDRLNPRSSKRPLVTGALSIREAYLVVVAGSLLYYLSAALLNKYALLYSPILWLLAHTYPYAKRIHSYPHYHLGLVLGFTVFGGAVAVAGSQPGADNWMVLRSVPWIYLVAVTLWVAGFDIYYSVLDYDFDKSHGIGSVPAKHGKQRAMLIGLATHLAASALLLAGVAMYWGTTGWFTLTMTLAAIAIMLYGDVKCLRDENYIPRAFNQNLAVGILISLGIILDYALHALAH
ncbi:MAG: putative 4-hydroxybenzoate polyprenyltransferase [Desulfurococcales archaeon]|nr:putative 4-hydroxybenzoate polyprenyltransferase [Desulfurococcales archaeon]